MNALALLSKCISGDPAACHDFLAHLIRFQDGLIRLLCVRCEAGFHDAEDAVQECFLHLIRQAQAGELLRPVRRWWPWLYWKARRILERNRTRAVRQTPLIQDEETRQAILNHPDPREGTPLDRAIMRESFASVVQEAALHLTESQRRVLFARSQDFTYEEIAEIVGTTAGAGRVHFSNAVRRLRTAFEDRQVLPPHLLVEGTEVPQDARLLREDQLLAAVDGLGEVGGDGAECPPGLPILVRGG